MSLSKPVPARNTIQLREIDKKLVSKFWEDLSSSTNTYDFAKSAVGCLQRIADGYDAVDNPFGEQDPHTYKYDIESRIQFLEGDDHAPNKYPGAIANANKIMGLLSQGTKNMIVVYCLTPQGRATFRKLSLESARQQFKPVQIKCHTGKQIAAYHIYMKAKENLCPEPNDKDYLAIKAQLAKEKEEKRKKKAIEKATGAKKQKKDTAPANDNNNNTNTNKDEAEEGDEEDEEMFKLPKSPIDFFDLWLSHPNRRLYNNERMAPYPDKHPKAAMSHELNTFTGFAIKKEDVSDKCFFNYSYIRDLLNHLRYSWCDTDEQFRYLLSWCAHVVQRPWEKPGTSIMVAGEQGTGKSWFWGLMLRIIGDAHAIQVQDMRAVMGEFNEVLTNKILVFMDECNIKNNQELAAMKNYITGEKLSLHAKFQDHVNEDSFHRFVAATNELKKFMPAEAKDRRVFALHSKIRELLRHRLFQHSFREEKDYFDNLIISVLKSKKCEVTGDRNKKSIPEFGLKVFANLLYNWPLDGYVDATGKEHPPFDPRKIPESPLMAKQKVESMSPLEKFWLDKLCDKYIPPFGLVPASYKLEWPSNYALVDMFNLFKAQSGNYTSKDKEPPNNDMEFQQQLEVLLPNGIEITKQEQLENGSKKVITSLVIPSIQQCRDFFEERFRGMKYFFALKDKQQSEGMSKEDKLEIERNIFDRAQRIESLRSIDYQDNYPLGIYPVGATAMFERLKSGYNKDKPETKISQHFYPRVLPQADRGVIYTDGDTILGNFDKKQYRKTRERFNKFKTPPKELPDKRLMEPVRPIPIDLDLPPAPAFEIEIPLVPKKPREVPTPVIPAPKKIKRAPTKYQHAPTHMDPTPLVTEDEGFIPDSPVPKSPEPVKKCSECNTTLTKNGRCENYQDCTEAELDGIFADVS